MLLLLRVGLEIISPSGEILPTLCVELEVFVVAGLLVFCVPILAPVLGSVMAIIFPHYVVSKKEFKYYINTI